MATANILPKCYLTLDCRPCKPTYAVRFEVVLRVLDNEQDPILSFLDGSVTLFGDGDFSFLNFSQTISSTQCSLYGSVYAVPAKRDKFKDRKPKMIP